MGKRIAVITGASSGIGKEFAKTVSDHGIYDELWVIARNEEKLLSLKNLVPFPLRTFALDLTKECSIDVYKDTLCEEKPEICLLINCSGYGKFDSCENLLLNENLGMIDLNCRALTAVCCLSLPYMSSGSEIINISSVAAFQPIPYINVYGASKAYVLSFSRALNRELKARNIHVLAVCPFWTKTAFFDRAVNTEKKAVVKKYAAMYESSYIVKYAWRALKHKNKDYCIPGFIAKMQVLMVKILPHRLVMTVWQYQQKLK